MKAFVEEMSSGVSYFEQFVWDLESRGVSDIDIPVLILGLDAVDGTHSDPPSKRDRSPKSVSKMRSKHRRGPPPKSSTID